MATVMECVRNWLTTYPELKGRVDVDFLDEDADAYSIDTVPCKELVKRYRDGSTVKQFQFVIASRRVYEQNIGMNLENLKFFEDLTAWIENKAAEKQLPIMDNNRTALNIEVTSTAYPFVVSEDGKARYQLQVTLYYFTRRSR